MKIAFIQKAKLLANAPKVFGLLKTFIEPAICYCSQIGKNTCDVCKAKKLIEKIEG